MRLAATILGIGISILMGLQSCTVYTLSEVIAEPENSIYAGGMAVAFLIFVGAAFAYKVPIIAILVFGLAGWLAISAGSPRFPDLEYWGYAALGLAVITILGLFRG